MRRNQPKGLRRSDQGDKRQKRKYQESEVYQKSVKNKTKQKTTNNKKKTISRRQLEKVRQGLKTNYVDAICGPHNSSPGGVQVVTAWLEGVPKTIGTRISIPFCALCTKGGQRNRGR